MTFLSIYQYDKLNEACFVNKKNEFLCIDFTCSWGNQYYFCMS